MYSLYKEFWPKSNTFDGFFKYINNKDLEEKPIAKSVLNVVVSSVLYRPHSSIDAIFELYRKEPYLILI